MALQLRNPAGLYQGEAPLNPLPYVNIALQQRARRQAREDAIDKYYRELPNTINDIGYRDWETDRKSTRLNSSHSAKSRMPSSA